MNPLDKLLDFASALRQINCLIMRSLSYDTIIQLQMLRDRLMIIDSSDLDILLMKIKCKKDRNHALKLIKDEANRFLEEYTKNGHYFNIILKDDGLMPILRDQIDKEYNCDSSTIIDESPRIQRAINDCGTLSMIIDNPGGLMNEDALKEDALKSLGSMGYKVTFDKEGIDDLEKRLHEEKEISERSISMIGKKFYELKDSIDKTLFSSIYELVQNVASAVNGVESDLEVEEEQKSKDRKGFKGYPKYENLSECLGVDKFAVLKEVAGQYIGKFNHIDPRFCSYAIDHYGGPKSLKCSKTHFVELVKQLFNEKCLFEPKSVYAYISNDAVRDKWLTDTFKIEEEKLHNRRRSS